MGNTDPPKKSIIELSTRRQSEKVIYGLAVCGLINKAPRRRLVGTTESDQAQGVAGELHNIGLHALCPLLRLSNRGS